MAEVTLIAGRQSGSSWPASWPGTRCGTAGSSHASVKVPVERGRSLRVVPPDPEWRPRTASVAHAPRPKTWVISLRGGTEADTRFLCPLYLRPVACSSCPCGGGSVWWRSSPPRSSAASCRTASLSAADTAATQVVRIAEVSVSRPGELPRRHLWQGQPGTGRAVAGVALVAVVAGDLVAAGAAAFIRRRRRQVGCSLPAGARDPSSTRLSSPSSNLRLPAPDRAPNGGRGTRHLHQPRRPPTRPPSSSFRARAHCRRLGPIQGEHHVEDHHRAVAIGAAHAPRIHQQRTPAARTSGSAKRPAASRLKRPPTRARRRRPTRRRPLPHPPPRPDGASCPVGAGAGRHRHHDRDQGRRELQPSAAASSHLTAGAAVAGDRPIPAPRPCPHRCWPRCRCRRHARRGGQPAPSVALPTKVGSGTILQGQPTASR